MYPNQKSPAVFPSQNRPWSLAKPVLTRTFAWLSLALLQGKGGKVGRGAAPRLEESTHASVSFFQTVQCSVGPRWTPTKKHIPHLSRVRICSHLWFTGFSKALLWFTQIFLNNRRCFKNITFDQRRHLTGKH